ncbi:MAG TPA: hypothetical protein VK903_10715, partial [Propionicimonas sp.]|nr:hypothetical protein [Propionicimonas sp.]
AQQHPLPVPEEGAQRPSRRAVLRVLAIAFLIVQLVAVYLPGTPDGGLELPWLPGADKVVHGLIFAIPVYLFARLSGRVGLVAGLFAVHAVVSELIQWRFVPYRDGDVWDVVADLLGIGVAALAALYPKPASWR